MTFLAAFSIAGDRSPDAWEHFHRVATQMGWFAFSCTRSWISPLTAEEIALLCPFLLP